MTQNAFLRLIRQYAALARRTGKSYAEAVNALVDARLEAIDTDKLVPAQRAQQMEDVKQAAVREYGSVDRDFAVRLEQN